MHKPVLGVESVSKKFCRSLKRSLWYGMGDLAAEILLRGDARDELRRSEFWALKDVSFELRPGETMGLIGSNGAGKSTLLKLINGLIRPDTGCIRVRGQIGALIELGAGFNPILTGRENIYVNAAVLGLRKEEVDSRLDEIVDFAEIGDFIDAPLQTYSSGMKVRLGFSVASNLNPDILLIDEVLSVGDSSFRQRCIDRLTAYKRNGGTIIFVSHNSVTVEAISDRVMMLDHGQVVEVGKPRNVVSRYETQMQELSRQADRRIHSGDTSRSGDHIRVTDLQCYDMAGNQKAEFEFGEPFEIRMYYETNEDIRFPYFIVAVRKGARENPLLSMMTMAWDSIRLESIPRQGVVGCMVRDPSIAPGVYHLVVGVMSQISARLGQKWYMPYAELGSFTVTPGALTDLLPGAPGAQLISRIPPMILEHSWHLDGCNLSNTESSVRETEQTK